MAKEHKYNLDVPQIEGDEPIILFRAQDATLPALLETYAMLCRALGSPEQHVEHIRAIRSNVLFWQGKNKETLWLFEVKAAERHGRLDDFMEKYPNSDNIEKEPICEKCGHIGCPGTCY